MRLHRSLPLHGQYALLAAKRGATSALLLSSLRSSVVCACCIMMLLRQATVSDITRFQQEAGETEVSLLNFVVSDGPTLVATRYVSRDDCAAATMYYAEGALTGWSTGVETCCAAESSQRRYRQRTLGEQHAWMPQRRALRFWMFVWCCQARPFGGRLKWRPRMAALRARTRAPAQPSRLPQGGKPVSQVRQLCHNQHSLEHLCTIWSTFQSHISSNGNLIKPGLTALQTRGSTR